MHNYTLFACSLNEGDRPRFYQALSWFIQRLSSAKSTGLWLVAVEEPVCLAAALVACWRGGVTPLISADLQAGVLDEMQESIEGALTDTPLMLQKPVCQLPNDFAVTEEIDLSQESYGAEDIALYLFTSGSSGKRVRVAKTYRALFEEVQTLEETFGSWRVGKKSYATVSPFHIYGLLFSVLWPLRFGHAFALKQNLYWEELLGTSTLPEGESAVFISSPAHLAFLPHIQEAVALQWQESIIFCSGGPLERECARAIDKAIGVTPTEVFGSTETGGVAWRQQAEESESPFTPLVGVEVRQDGDNRLEVRSPWLDNPKAFVPSGDYAQFAQKNSFFLRGRVDRIAKIAGKRISLTEMEAIVKEDAFVVDCRVLPVEEKRHVTRTTILAVVAAGASYPRIIENQKEWVQTMKKHLIQRFPRVAVPRKWRFVETLPVNSQGKISYESLKELL